MHDHRLRPTDCCIKSSAMFFIGHLGKPECTHTSVLKDCIKEEHRMMFEPVARSNEVVDLLDK
jgi:hypothetical protein